jgi:hypothetical protein
MKIFREIKERGFAKSLKIAYQIIQPRLIPGCKKLIIFESMLNKKYPDVKLKEGIEIDIVKNAEELRDFSKLRGDWYFDYAKDTLSKGNYCFVARVNGKIVSCLWTAFNQYYFKEIQYNFKVEKNIAPLIDAYTLDEYRKMGLYKILWYYCINFLIDLNKYDRIYGPILYKNKRSLLVHSKLDLNKVVMKIIMIKGLGFRFHITKKYR